MKVRVVVAVAIAAVCAATAPAQGQGGFSVAPKVGLFVPTTQLGTVPITADVYDVRKGPREAGLRSGFSFGVTGQYDLHNRPFGLRVDVAHAPSLEVAIQDTTHDVIRASVSSIGFSLVKPFRLEQFRPFVMAGLGLRSYSFQPALSHGPQFPDSNFDTEGLLGGGVALDVRRFTISAEIEDHFGTFQFENDKGEGGSRRRLQNNLFLSFAVRMRLY